jgi:hypothetical protein
MNVVEREDYESGRMAIYRNGFDLLEVQVLENWGNETHEKYLLKVLRVVESNPLCYLPRKVGETFVCGRKRNTEFRKIWKLSLAI